MNWIDLAILLVLALSVLFGLYKGFVRTVTGIISFFLAWIIAISFYPLLASGLKKNDAFVSTIRYYTSDTSRLGKYIDTPINSLKNEEEVKSLIKKVGIPAPLDGMLAKNILKQNFLKEGKSTLGQYLTETVFSFAVNIIAFLLLFILVKILSIIALHAIDYAMKLPILSNFNTALGGAFGFLSGLLLLFVIFSVIPLILSAIPSESIEAMIDKSLLAKLFTNANIISGLLRSTL